MFWLDKQAIIDRQMFSDQSFYNPLWTQGINQLHSIIIYNNLTFFKLNDTSNLDPLHTAYFNELHFCSIVVEVQTSTVTTLTPLNCELS